MNPDLEAALRAALERATAGDWYTLDPPWLQGGAETSILAESPDPHVARFICDFDLWALDDDDRKSENPDDDARFIALAKNHMGDLLDTLTALRAQVEGRSQAATDVLTERQRQIESEGWTPEHDDEHWDGSIAQAAAAYAYSASGLGRSHGRLWPWHPDGWRPTDRRRDLVKAGALILAEIERLDRASIRGGQS